jgi:hypothetical protein
MTDSKYDPLTPEGREAIMESLRDGTDLEDLEEGEEGNAR